MAYATNTRKQTERETFCFFCAFRWESRRIYSTFFFIIVCGFLLKLVFNGRKILLLIVMRNILDGINEEGWWFGFLTARLKFFFYSIVKLVFKGEFKVSHIFVHRIERTVRRFVTSFAIKRRYAIKYQPSILCVFFNQFYFSNNYNHFYFIFRMFLFVLFVLNFWKPDLQLYKEGCKLDHEKL